MAFLKRGKKGILSAGVVLSFIASILIVMLIVFAMITQTKLTEGRAFMTYSYVRDEVLVGSDLFYIDAVDGRNSYLDNGTALIRLSPTSGALRLDKTLLKINTMNSTRHYIYGGVGRYNSTIGNGTGTFGVEFVTRSDNHHTDILNVGEVARIHFIFPSKVGEDDIIEFYLYPHNGRAEKKRIKIPEAIKAERVQLFP